MEDKVGGTWRTRCVGVPKMFVNEPKKINTIMFDFVGYF